MPRPDIEWYRIHPQMCQSSHCKDIAVYRVVDNKRCYAWYMCLGCAMNHVEGNVEKAREAILEGSAKTVTDQITGKS